MELHSEQRTRVYNKMRQSNDQTHAARQTNSKSTIGGVKRWQFPSARIEILRRKRQLDFRDWKKTQ
jgi:hypothetical protein